MLCAAREAGVDRLFRIGGAHAIAALAYGTATMPRVDKIVGPGNAYVAAAKALVASDCAIDFFAGPSEIAVSRRPGAPAWIAADLIAQAEHDPDARAILITPSTTARARRSRAPIARQMPADGPAPVALARNGGIVVTRTLDEAIALSQRHGAGTPRLRLRRGRGQADHARERCSSATTAPRRAATTSPAPTTCCRRAAPPPAAAG